MILFATIQETKKNFRTAGLLISMIGCLFLLLISRCYVDESMVGHTIIELLLSKNANDTAIDNGLSYFMMLRLGAGQWFGLFAPAVLTIGFQTAIYYERERSALTYIMMREKTAVYCGSKLAAGMLAGGMTSVASYSLYILIIKIRLKEAFDVLKMDDINTVHAMGYNGVWELSLRYIAGVFLFGSVCFGFVYFVSIFFFDRYVLMCMPILIKYICDQVLTVISESLMRRERFEAAERLERYSISNLIPFDKNSHSLFTLLMGMSVIVILFFIALFVMKRRKKNGKTL